MLRTPASIATWRSRSSPEHFAEDEERLRRFEGEAKSLASLNHPNVAQIFGVDQGGATS